MPTKSNNKTLLFLSLILAIVFTVTFIYAGKNKNITTDNTQQQTPIDPNTPTIQEVLNEWNYGYPDHAVDLLIKMYENKYPIHTPIISKISEAQFKVIALKNIADGQKIVNDAIAKAPIIKFLAKHILAKGDKFLAAGDKINALKHYQTVLYLGQAINNSTQNLQLEKIFGPTLIKAANKKINGLKFHPKTINANH